MAIQFLCAACRQPIEVDDEAANQVVTCPYCRKVVTAPGNSDPTVHKGTPEARLPGEPLTGYPGPPTLPVAPGNRMAWISLGCTTVMCLCMCIVFGMTLSFMKSEGLIEKNSDPAKIREFMVEQQKSPGPTMQRISRLGFMLPIFGLSGIVTGIIGVIGHKRPKWPAIVSLVICGSFFLLFCVSSVLSIAAAQGMAK